MIGVLMAASCLPSPPGPGAGAIEPFHVPPPAAAALNAEALPLYRAGRWEEARQKYRAALAADPEFAAPLLNVACSFVRQDRFDEATAGVIDLIGRGYVPWARQIVDAADLGALKVRRDWARVEAALSAAALDWGAGLDEAVLFVARRKAPLRLPAKGDAVLVIALQQEIYAFLPTTGRYRQLTVEDGRVMGWARSADGRRLAYVTAEKLVLQGGVAQALRGVAVHTLELRSMTAGPVVRVPGDVRSIELAHPPGGPLVRLESDRFQGVYALEGEALAARRAVLGQATRIRPTGVTGPSRQAVRGACAGSALEVRGESGSPEVELDLPAGRKIRLRAPSGAGLYGLPLPLE